ncbi:MAG: hypothetical protein IJ301_03025 [Clostridia bacterium]|nr:hypothetical protein [Clostridia bacterium]
MKDGEYIKILEQKSAQLKRRNIELKLYREELEQWCAHYNFCLQIFNHYFKNQKLFEKEIVLNKEDNFFLNIKPKYPKNKRVGEIPHISSNNPKILMLAGEIAGLQIENTKLENTIAHLEADKKNLEMKIKVYEKKDIYNVLYHYQRLEIAVDFEQSNLISKHNIYKDKLNYNYTNIPIK